MERVATGTVCKRCQWCQNVTSSVTFKIQQKKNNKQTKQNRPTLFIVALQSSSNNCQRTFNNELTAGPLCIFVTEGLSNDISAAIFSFTFGNVEHV